MKNIKFLFFLSIGLFALLACSCKKHVKTITISPVNDSISMFDSTGLTLANGTYDYLTASITPADLPDTLIHWISEDPEIVEVENGTVYGKSVGNAYVYAYAEDKYDSCLVKVVIPIEKLTLNRSHALTEPGKSVKLKATIKPKKATCQMVEWESSDTTIAIVDADGNVTGIREGEAIITAKAERHVATCRLTVRTMTEMERIIRSKGGNVDGDVRFSLMWNDKSDWNEDDLDAYCKVPTGRYIYYRQKKDSWSGGSLDVDNTHPGYRQKAVENITWNNISNMPNGTYRFGVDLYRDRGGASGFRAQMAVDGHLYQYNYNGNYYGGSVEVVTITVKDGHAEVHHILPAATMR